MLVHTQVFGERSEAGVTWDRLVWFLVLQGNPKIGIVSAIVWTTNTVNGASRTLTLWGAHNLWMICPVRYVFLSLLYHELANSSASPFLAIWKTWRCLRGLELLGFMSRLKWSDPWPKFSLGCMNRNIESRMRNHRGSSNHRFIAFPPHSNNCTTFIATLQLSPFLSWCFLLV